MNALTTVLLSTSFLFGHAIAQSPKKIEMKNMEVSWYYQSDRIQIEMSAPTVGWVAIAFNDQPAMTGAYLLMGRVVDGKAELVEHYTSSPGTYRPITELGAAVSVSDVTGEESPEGIVLRFSLPITSQSEFAQDLDSGKVYTLTLAYSRSDDFQHHSMMRTSVIQEL